MFDFIRKVYIKKMILISKMRDNLMKLNNFLNAEIFLGNRMIQTLIYHLNGQK